MLDCYVGIGFDFKSFVITSLTIMVFTPPPNNSPEPTPIRVAVPHSRLTWLAARLSFCR
jgi:hypothetical protein